MPTPQQIAQVYDFERVLELALKYLFTCNQLKAFTTQMIESSGDDATDEALAAAGWDIVDYEKDRPRVEIMFTAGAGQKIFINAMFLSGEFPVETSFKGQFKLDLITAADMRIHTAFRAMVRFLMHTQIYTLNNNPNGLTLHRIQVDVVDGGTTPVMRPEDGTMQTSMLFDIDFSIQADAWQLLDDMVATVVLGDPQGDVIVDKRGDVIGPLL